ncbi:hypothetical protein O3P69_009827 [Scylla paramamosain]|uniref:Uncharacterized protein n=1 Tax=Scylla paramamosain TaxID=85552 RepID=A0AAW0SM58_SCYPA
MTAWMGMATVPDQISTQSLGGGQASIPRLPTAKFYYDNNFSRLKKRPGVSAGITLLNASPSPPSLML